MTPEQTPSEVPETPEEVAVDNETKGRRISVEAAADELKRFDDLGPDSDEVKQWLADNGITENDQIVANGNVYVANSHDFLTRDLAATQELAVEAARAMLEGPQTSQEDQTAVQPTAEVEALESNIDSRTAEIIEEEPRVTREEAEKIGEEVVEDSGVVQNPSESENDAAEGAGELSPADRRYKELAEISVQDFVENASEQSERMSRSVGYFDKFVDAEVHFEREANECERLRHAYESRPDKNNGDLIALYRGRIDVLFGLKGAYKNLVEGAGYLDDFDKSIGRLDTIIDAKKSELDAIDENFKAATGRRSVPESEGMSPGRFSIETAGLEKLSADAKAAIRTVESAYQDTISKKVDEAIGILTAALERVESGQPYAEGFNLAAKILTGARDELKELPLESAKKSANAYSDAISSLILKARGE